jgi:hypothetical protein
MDNIIEPNEMFDFSKISLAHPVGIQGGAYFTKIELSGKPLYIQTSKSLSRQGFVKSGKKYYCDLMFDKNSETLIHWFENLEEISKKLIYEKKDAWFQGSLEETDIENAFNPLIRVYKSGKYYLLRTNIKNTKEDVPSIKIYNENEIMLNISDITPETEMISILEIQGIKFTSRNFQIEIELKQIMVLDNEPIFESCLIKTKSKVNKNEQLPSFPSSFEEKKDDLMKNELKDIMNTLEEFNPEIFDNKNQDSINNNNNNNNNNYDDEILLSNNEELIEIKVEKEGEKMDGNEKEKENEIVREKAQNNVNIDFEDLTNNIEENNEILKEIGNDDFKLEDDTITLKKPNQVYFELYKEAREKAKQAKKNAIIAYLQAKNIKKTYMIENMNDSDSDLDQEIDEVSESELEGL